MLRIAAIVPLFALLAHGQTFEAASVKPAAPMPMGMMRVRTAGGPGTPDPGRIDYENVSLLNLLTNAFNVKDFQVFGPAFLDTERFDVTAKLPPNSSKEQMRTMLQNLLAERFQMKVHREKKEMAAFSLSVGKNGLKMKASDPEPPKDPDAPAATDPGPGPGRMTRPGARDVGKDGFPDFGGGRRAQGMMITNGKAKLVCMGCPISRLLDMLSNQLGKPLVDATGLTGNYDINLIFEPNMRGMPMMAGPGRGPDGPGPSIPEETAPPLMTALQEQLGLRLESKKADVDLIMIDHIEKVATDN